jgi:hypothetical protein
MSVRAALLPRLAEAGSTSPLEGSSTASLSFSSPMTDSFSGLNLSVPDSSETPIAVSTLRPSALTKIQEFLLRGERRQAYHFALDEKLWAHAMVIASSIDKEAWKEVVNEFLRTELGMKDDNRRLPALPKANELSSRAMNGREWLRVAYSLFSGQGPAAGKHCSWFAFLIRTHDVRHSSRIDATQPAIRLDERFANTDTRHISYYSHISEFPIAIHDG